MSQRSAAAGAESTYSNNGTRSGHASSETSKLPPILNGPSLPSPRTGEHSRTTLTDLPGFAMHSRPSSATYTASDTEQATSRPLKVHNILNHSGGSTELSNQRVSSQQGTPPLMSTSSSRYPSDSSPESIVNRVPTPGTTLPPINMYSSTTGHGSTLIPTSNMMTNRGIAPRANPPNATIDAKVSPFVPGGGHIYNPPLPTSSHPTMSMGTTPPVAPRLSYGFPGQQINTPDRRPSEANIPTPLSQSNSPSTSYSSYSQPCHTSPGLTFSAPASQPTAPRYYGSLGTNGGGGSIGPQITLASDSSYGPVAGTVGQSPYQIMTLDTDQGPIQVPVEVQAASKMADEKRKRNAGASARFRQRRKEKEKEASQTIAKLENQIREIGEEREYYRAERDYFRNLVYNSSAQSLVVPRLPSPRQRKTPGQTSAPDTRQIEPQWEQTEDRGGQEGRNTRRRISGPYPSTYELPPPPMSAPTQLSGYPGHVFPFPKPESRAHTPVQRLPPPDPPRIDRFDPSVSTIYERGWGTSQ